MVKDCEKYPQNQNCQCITSMGDDIRNFKQFNKDSHTYHCCLELDVTPSQLKKFLDDENGGTCTKSFGTASDYYSEIIRYKGTSLIGHGCSFGAEGYSISDIRPEESERHQLYKNIVVDQSIYNHYFKDHKPPEFTDSSVSCSGLSEEPYILDYRGTNRDSIFDKTTYFCSNNSSPNLFPSISNPGGDQINFSVYRFYDADGNVYKNGSPNLKNKNGYSIESRMNNPSVFENHKNEPTLNLLIPGCVLGVLSLICLILILVYFKTKRPHDNYQKYLIAGTVVMLIASIILIVFGVQGSNGDSVSQNNKLNQFTNTMTPKKNNIF